MRRSRMRATAVAAIAGLTIAAGGTAVAATGTGSGTGPSAFVDAVAAKLGISSEELRDATKAAAIDQVDAQLKAGTITQEQADAMKERIQAGDGLGFGPGPGGPHGGHGGPGGHLDDAAAFLGLTTEALMAQLQSGTTLADVAEAQGRTVAGLKAALLASEKKELADAVATGRLTQAQADEILAGASERFDAMIEGSFPPRGPHGAAPGTTSSSGETAAAA